MISCRLASAFALTLGLTIALAGCARTQRPAEPPPPANQDRAMALRQRLLSENPNVQAGIVTAVLPEQRLAAVSDLDVSKFRPGLVVTFVDSQGNPLVAGEVVRTTSDSVHIKYHEPAADRRAPQKGDLAVRVP
jgi:hypothetical protein